MAKSQDFLFELYTEEIPAFYQQGAYHYWCENLVPLLKQELLEFQDIKFFATPRRLGFYITDLAEVQKKIKKVLRGPAREICFADGQPTKALLGFAAKANLSWQEVSFVSDGKKEFAQVEIEIGGKNAFEVMGDVLGHFVLKTPFPKTMRWANFEFLYARPILGYYAQYGENLVFFPKRGIWNWVKSLNGIFVDFGFPEKIQPLKQAKDYFVFLESHGILVEVEKRRNYIAQELEAKAKSIGLKWVKNEELLEEVNFLVEAPKIFVAEFPKEFLKLPDCVILSEMQTHQRYFALENDKKEISSKFLIVANTLKNNDEVAKNIIRGNERVLKARLEDGAFYYEEDRKTQLWDKVPELKKIQFLENLGTMYDKAARLIKHAKALQKHGVFPEIKPETIERTAFLCKADLSTKLVYEFDHLQGEIGSIYARLDQEREDIAVAIFEHYLPRHQKDQYPNTPLGILLSLSDKLDNLVSGFLSGKEPTATTDPLGLRRQTIYLLEIILKNNLSFSFQSLLSQITTHFTDLVNLPEGLELKIWDFVRNRFVTIFEKEGFSIELIRAGIYSGSDDIYDLYLKISALQKLQKTPTTEENFTALLLSFKRMKNIVEDFKQNYPEEKIPLTVNEELLRQNEEKSLYEFALKLEELLQYSEKQKKYDEVFSFLARNKPTIDLFFDKVMVMHENLDLRQNRLALLQKATSKVQNLLDLSLIGK